MWRMTLPAQSVVKQDGRRNRKAKKPKQHPKAKVTMRTVLLDVSGKRIRYTII